MTQFSKDLADSLPVLSAVALAVSAFSAILALVSLVTSRQALRISKSQELRRKEKLAVQVLSVVREDGDSDIAYIYQLEIRNRADRANSVARAELLIAYRVHDALVTASVLADPASAVGLAGVGDIPANQTRVATIEIQVPKAATEDHPIDHIELVITDTFGTRYVTRSDHIASRSARGDA